MSNGQNFLEIIDDFPCDRQIPQLFADIVKQYPDRIALVEDGKSPLTYRELDKISDSIAAGLIAQGVKADETVGVFIDRSINYVTAILSVLKSGGGYVPIDPDIPEERLKLIINDTGCKQILSESNYTGKLSGFMDQVTLLDKIDISALTPLAQLPDISPSSLAYVIYTSGSTGAPKGVEIEHHSLLNLVLWHHKTFIEEGHYLYGQSAGPGFDASVEEIWAHLTSGATIYIIPEMLRLQPQKLVDWLTANKINECYLSTPVAELVLSVNWKNNSTLKYLHCGGEKLNRKPEQGFPGVLVNLYGPTECTVDSTFSIFRAGEDDDKPPHIGIPVSNFRIYILDDKLQQVPRGSEGEICIGGAGVGRGYRNLINQTNTAFIADPFRSGERIYRSGDLGCINADGNIECAGRKDFQVKLRGFRIELGEIEMVLSKHANMSKCVVVAREKGNGVKYLASYSILKNPQDTCQLANELRELAGKNLPEYMVPSTYTVLQELPLTLNGKVNRKALPEPEFTHGDPADSALDSEDPLVRTLASIWRRILKLDYINIEDNFFMIGGHSLLATVLSLEIEKELNVQLPIHQVFTHPTITALANAIRTCTASSRSTVRFEKVKETANMRYPASIAQSGMWFLEKGSHTANSFNIPFEIQLYGAVKPDIFQKAFNLIIRQHVSLRSSFEFSGEQLYYKVNPAQNIEIPLIDLSELPAAEQERRYREELGIQRFQIFDLSVFPLFNTMLLKLRENEYRFIFTIHHLTFDGWSNTLFFKQLGDYYQLLSQGIEPELKPDDWSYTDFCLWQSRYVKTGVFQSQLKYWQKKLENSPATPPLPNQKRLQSKSHGNSIRYYVEINQEITGRLKKLASENNASLFMVLTALLHLQIHKYTGATDIATGTAIANRNFPELDQIFGLFTNALVLRNEIKGNPSLKDFLEQIKNTTIEAYENQDVPFDMLLKSCARNTQHGRVPLFKISMLLQNLPWPEMEFSGVKMRYYELGSDSAKMDLYIVFEERDGGLYGWYEYDTELFDEKAIKTIFNHYLRLAEKVTAKPDGLMSDIQLSWDNIRRRPGCYITGETALTKVAGDILLNNGFYINGIFTAEAKSLEWAREHEIPCHPPQKKLISDILSSVRPDYLFSIINSCVLDQHILDQPLKYAINYHDAPLPRYAGLHSTAWAIINHEPEHAVTWHQMTVEIDAGDILKQQRVSISPYDTSVSLNVKCAQEAIGAFESLVHDLKDGYETPVAQDLSKRTYNAQNRRPDDACVIDFSQNIEEISALARALDFGDYENPLGTLKFSSGDTIYMFKEFSIANRKQTASPGIILEVNKDYVGIAAGNGVVKLSGICDLEGNPANIAAIGLQPGQLLTEKIDRKLLDTYYKECASSEMFWTKRLRSPQLPEIAMLETADGISRDRVNVFAMDSAPSPEFSPAAVLALFLARASCLDEFDIPISPACPAAIDFPAVFADILPFRVKLDFSKTVEANLVLVEKNLKSILDKKTFCRDISFRFKQLRKLPPAPFRVKINGDGSCDLELFQQDAGQFMECYRNFCVNIQKSMTSPLRSISILTEAEESGILYEWNNTARDFDLNTPYIRQFEKQVEKYPDKTAVKSDGNSLTYKELDYRANCLAERLLQQVTGSNRIIGVLTDKSLEMAVAILGIFKAGCTYMPLDIQRQSPERIEAMIYDSGTEIILSAVRDKSQEPKTIPGYVKVIDLAASGLFTGSGFQNPLKADIAVTDTAYIMYTSGSTGVPKGVMISHSNLLNHNYSVIGDYALTEKDNILQFSTLGFDISVEEIFPCWLVGGTLVFMPDGMLESPEDLFLFIKQEKISFLDLPTSYWHEIAAMLKGPDFPECVRVIAIGGEKASPERFARWRKYVPGTRVINTYGPTETTVIATLGDDPETIGRPMANTHVYVLDKLRQPVPRGAYGELYIGGASVAKGYLNKPEETAAAFMDNPFVKGERMYKTGDKVKFAPNGELIFAGRMDDQFKIRGFRVEPGDIETVLSSHPDIRTAVIKLWLNEKTGMKSLAAYFVPAVKTYNLNSIREYAKSQLPEYMVPACFTAIDSVPMTPNGKINRKALPAPEIEIAASQDETLESSEPRNPLEMQLRLIFRKLLNRENFDRNTSFFELGGDSLSAIKLALEIENAIGIKIPVNELYRLSSLDALADYLQGRTEKEQAWSPIVLLADNGVRPPLFLVHTTPGDILGYINLVNHLDNRPVYGIQAYGLHDPENAHQTIEDMAAYYIAEILKIYPEGPYYLCGWCFGGIAAYEMAQQLKKMGKQVAFLGLIETYANLKPSLYNDFYRLLCLLKTGPKGCLDYLTAKMYVKFGKDQNIEQLDFISQRFADAANEQTIQKMKMVYRRNMNAATNYSMAYYDGKISLFMVETPIKGVIPLPLYGWSKLCRSYELFISSADHRDVLKEPNVLPVAEKIIECMVDAEQNSC